MFSHENTQVQSSLHYHKSSIKPPDGVCVWGGLFISSAYEGGGVLNRDRWFKTENTKRISSSTRSLEVMQPRIKNNSELPVGK